MPYSPQRLSHFYAHVARGNEGQNKYSYRDHRAAHVSQSTRPLRHKFRGFNKDSWLPLAECTAAVYGSARREDERADVVSYDDRFTP